MNWRRSRDAASHSIAASALACLVEGAALSAASTARRCGRWLFRHLVVWRMGGTAAGGGGERAAAAKKQALTIQCWRGRRI
jgi:hypothetical protein